MIYGYSRVSTKDQNLDRQIIALQEYGVDKIISDKKSGKDFDRPNYQTMKEFIRPGDTLVIKELDRLGRNKEMVKEELKWFKEHGIRVKILNVPTSLMDIPEGQEWIIDMINNILIEVLGAVAEEERNKIRQRQREGIDAAQAKGVHCGRPRIDFPDTWEPIYKAYRAKEITSQQAMDSLGLKKFKFFKLLKEWEEK